MKEQMIELKKIRFKENRTHGGEGDIQLLAESIKMNGLINAITVKPEANGFNEGVAGRRRRRAAAILGWEKIRCNVLEGDEVARADEIDVAENVNRLGMHPLDEAAVFKNLLGKGESIEALSKRFDRKVSEIWQRIQLLDLNEDIAAMFRKGNLSLHSAAMLNSLDENGQKEFSKQYKNDWAVKHGGEIQDHRISSFISSLGHDHLYEFLKDKQCAECKTRTYFSNKTLFPELDRMDDSCLNRDCYMKKWNCAFANRIKSLKGEKKSHAAAGIIVSNDDIFRKIMGSKATIDGTVFEILPYCYNSDAKANEKGAKPCFNVNISVSGKLEIKPEYWKEPEKMTYGSSVSSASRKKDFNSIVKVLDLPKTEMDEAVNALENRKRLIPGNFKNNVRDAVFWRIMEIKAQEFNDPKKTDSVSKEEFLKKHLIYLHGNGKRVFEMFAGKMKASELAKLTSDKVFLLLAAMEQKEYELHLSDFEKGKLCDILQWAGIPNEKLKQLYQEEIRKRIPKKKPETKKPAEKKAKAAEKSAVKKTAKKKLPGAKKITAVQKAKPAAKKTAARKPAKGK